MFNFELNCTADDVAIVSPWERQENSLLHPITHPIALQGLQLSPFWHSVCDYGHRCRHRMGYRCGLVARVKTLPTIGNPTWIRPILWSTINSLLFGPYHLFNPGNASDCVLLGVFLVLFGVHSSTPISVVCVLFFILEVGLYEIVNNDLRHLPCMHLVHENLWACMFYRDHYIS